MGDEAGCEGRTDSRFLKSREADAITIALDVSPPSFENERGANGKTCFGAVGEQYALELSQSA